MCARPLSFWLIAHTVQCFSMFVYFARMWCCIACEKKKQLNHTEFLLNTFLVIQMNVKGASPFDGMLIDPHGPLNKVTTRTNCPECGSSRKYFCYTCYLPMPGVTGVYNTVEVSGHEVAKSRDWAAQFLYWATFCAYFLHRAHRGRRRKLVIWQTLNSSGDFGRSLV